MNTMSIDSMKLAVCRESNPRWNESFQLKANDRVYVAIQDAKYSVSSSEKLLRFSRWNSRCIRETCREIFIRSLFN